MSKNSPTKSIQTSSPGVGGSYAADPVTGELTLIEPPTADAGKIETAPAPVQINPAKANGPADDNQENLS